MPGPAGPLPIRVYNPRPDAVLPIVIYYHGGGWIMGDLDTHDNNCRSIAAKAGVIVTAEIDVLRDDGETYAARLRAAGVPVVSRRYAGVIHGFMALERIAPRAAHAFDDI